MSHSRIFALRPVTDKTPNIFEPITSSMIDDSCSHFADYTDDVERTNWFDDVKWLTTAYEQFKLVDKQGELFITITLKDLKDLIDERIDLITDFFDKNPRVRGGDAFYSLNSLVNYQFGFHVCLLLDDTGASYPETFDWFLHNLYDHLVYEKIDEVILHVEGIIDYHC